MLEMETTTVPIQMEMAIIQEIMEETEIQEETETMGMLIMEMAIAMVLTQVWTVTKQHRI